ncbi:MAG: FAD-binding oxidoreductase [Solirubrobacteraceae bacterium]|nr:FAD-binding oxidoreductase [Solirubrobacteraceae bacterium]
MTATLLPSAAPEAVHGLALELRELLGPRRVTTEIRAREKASLDGSTMSPVISAQYPLGLADLVAFPASAEEIAVVVAAAVRHGVPITTRGKGTGNYGQAIPMQGGLVLDTTKATAIVTVEDGLITAECGARMIALETAARETGQQLWMYPSTLQSTVGGFLGGGSGGTGTIKYGSNWNGFVAALDVVHATPDAQLIHVEGADSVPYVHSYGVGGVIARATVRLEPLQDWRCVYASYPDFAGALGAVRELRKLDPLPRLVSADPPALVGPMPDDPAIPKGRASVRTILDASTVDDAKAYFASTGGVVHDERTGPAAPMAVSMLSYNHGVWWLMQENPGKWFHIEVAGEALIDRIDEVQAVLPGAVLHIEAAHTVPIGMLACQYEYPDQVFEGMDALGELGVGCHNPHQWFVDRDVEGVRALAMRTDPSGLLNPGKWKAEDAPAAPPASAFYGSET